MTATPVFPNLKQYPGSVNMLIEGDKAVPAFDYAAMTNSADMLAQPIRETVETVNPSGNPRHYFAANKSVFYFEDGARTTDQTFADVITGMAIVDDGTGVKKLFVGFGFTGTETNANAIRSLSTDTTPWTINANSGSSGSGNKFAQFWNLVTVGPNAIAVTGGGASGVNQALTALGEYHVAKLVFGDDPQDASLWGDVLPVGSPAWPIIGIVAFRNTFACAKGDGLWVLDDQTKFFFNVFDRLIDFPHALNGKGMFVGENSVWYPMADGRIFEFDGVTAREQTPAKSWSIPRDVALNRISAGADRGDVIALRTEPFTTIVEGARAATALGMKVITVINGTAADITSGVTDGSLATPSSANMNAWGALSTDKLYIGLNVPFEGAVLRVTRNPNAAVNSFTSPQYSDGAAGWPSLGTIRDGSILDTSGVSLRIVGYPVSGAASTVSWTSPQAYDLMVQETVSFGGSVGDLTMYWARFSPLTTTAMTSTTTIDEVDVLPSRGGLPNSGILTSATNFTHRDNAGGLGHIVFGRRVGGTIAWQDVYAIDDGGLCYAMGWTSAKSGTMTNGGPPLLLIGRYQQTVIAEGVTRDPVRTLYPKLVQPSSTKPCPKLAFRRINASQLTLDPTRPLKLNLIHFQGEFIQPTDKVSCYFWWDNADTPIELDSDLGSPGVFRVPAMYPSFGREMNFDLLFSDASQNDPAAPYFTLVVIDADSLGGTNSIDYRYAFQRDPAFPSGKETV